MQPMHAHQLTPGCLSLLCTHHTHPRTRTHAHSRHALDSVAHGRRLPLHLLARRLEVAPQLFDLPHRHGPVLLVRAPCRDSLSLLYIVKPLRELLPQRPVLGVLRHVLPKHLRLRGELCPLDLPEVLVHVIPLLAVVCSKAFLHIVAHLHRLLHTLVPPSRPLPELGLQGLPLPVPLLKLPRPLLCHVCGLGNVPRPKHGPEPLLQVVVKVRRLRRRQRSVLPRLMHPPCVTLRALQVPRRNAHLRLHFALVERLREGLLLLELRLGEVVGADMGLDLAVVGELREPLPLLEKLREFLVLAGVERPRSLDRLRVGPRPHLGVLLPVPELLGELPGLRHGEAHGGSGLLPVVGEEGVALPSLELLGELVGVCLVEVGGGGAVVRVPLDQPRVLSLRVGQLPGQLLVLVGVKSVAAPDRNTLLPQHMGVAGCSGVHAIAAIQGLWVQLGRKVRDIVLREAHGVLRSVPPRPGRLLRGSHRRLGGGGSSVEVLRAGWPLGGGGGVPVDGEAEPRGEIALLVRGRPALRLEVGEHALAVRHRRREGGGGNPDELHGPP
mmetsp:Transcript_11241/g.26131  ORF Transcript_11241/g.26131 Transcript_11241/m.26131 type:complete len:554 (+) Transcript_11241:3-1664(+)